MWFGLAKMALNTGAKVYANKQRQKEAMSQAALHTAEKMASGEIEYQGKLLEARQADFKEEFVLIILSAPILILAWAVFSDNPDALEKVMRNILLLISHYSSKLQVWSWQKLWSNRKTGVGYKK